MRICEEDRMAANHFGKLRDGASRHLAVARMWVKPTGVSMVTELARAKRHLKLAKEEREWALLSKEFIHRVFTVVGYWQLATLTVNSVSEDIAKAEPAVKRASDRVNPVSDEALGRVRQVKYKEADTYLRRQRVIHEAEQAAIEIAKAQAVVAEIQAVMAKGQAIIDRENKFLQLMMNLLYGDDL